MLQYVKRILVAIKASPKYEGKTKTTRYAPEYNSQNLRTLLSTIKERNNTIVEVKWQAVRSHAQLSLLI